MNAFHRAEKKVTASSGSTYVASAVESRSLALSPYVVVSL